MSGPTSTSTTSPDPARPGENSSIVITLSQLIAECDDADFKNEAGISKSLRNSAAKLQNLFLRIAETEDNGAKTSEINDDLVLVLDLLGVHREKKEGTHHKGVAFNKIASALDKFERAIKNDSVSFSALNEKSENCKRLDDAFSALVAAQMEILKDIDPKYFQTGGLQSVVSKNATIVVDGETGVNQGAFSKNTGAHRFIVSRTKATAKLGFFSGNNLKGDKGVVNTAGAVLETEQTFWSNNSGYRGDDNYVGARIKSQGPISSGNLNDVYSQMTMTMSNDTVVSTTAVDSNGQVSSVSIPNLNQISGMLAALGMAQAQFVNQQAAAPPVATKGGLARNYQRKTNSNAEHHSNSPSAAQSHQSATHPNQ